MTGAAGERRPVAGPEKREARARWESWGAWLASVSVGAVVVGAAVAAVGVAVGMSPGDDEAELNARVPALARTGSP